jgi:hypothetical protein
MQILQQGGNPKPALLFFKQRRMYACEHTVLDQSERARDYRRQAATLMRLANRSRFPEIRTRSLILAVSFERLADEVDPGAQDTSPDDQRHCTD